MDMSTAIASTPTVDWDGNAIIALDQRVLPTEIATLTITAVDDLIEAIRTLAIRGAPTLAVAGGYGVLLSAHHRTRDGMLDEHGLRADAGRLARARPTAVNLGWAIERILARKPLNVHTIERETVAIAHEIGQANETLSRLVADFVLTVCPRHPLKVLTHCNTGRLATFRHGTALGAIRELAARHRLGEVLVGETRPLFQGARITAWELASERIPFRVCVDSAGPAAIASGMIDCVIVGADRVCRNGDVANKIGTYSLALAARASGVPFVVAAPESTIDRRLASGSEIEIEMRPVEELRWCAGQRTTLPAVHGYNPAFDVTPANLITAIVTEARQYGGPDQAPRIVRDPLAGLPGVPSV
jgi:methylthioribose-1-phosphate isomerase